MGRHEKHGPNKHDRDNPPTVEPKTSRHRSYECTGCHLCTENIDIFLKHPCVPKITEP